MAITLIKTPIKYQPVYNNLTFIADSDKKALPKMKYIIQLYVDGALVSTSKMYPNPQGYAVYDPQTILKNYITSNFYTLENDEAQYADTSEVSNYQVYVSEEYIENNVLTSSLPVTSSLFNVWSAVADWEEGKNLNTYIQKFTPNTSFNSESNAAMYLGPRVYSDNVTGQSLGTGSIQTSYTFTEEDVSVNDPSKYAVLS